MDVLVVGAGTMGRWFAETIAAEVAFTDVDPGTARAAAEEVGGSAVSFDGSERFDVVCIAVPISVSGEAIADQADRATTAIVDVTGEMTGALAAMEEHAPDLERASLHPLFAPENAPGNVAVVEDRVGPTVRAILDALEAAGNDLVETTASEHDEAMETIQTAAHTAILAYGIAAEAVPAGFETPVSGPLDDLVEQVAGGNPDVYAEIQATFDGADRVADAAERIAAADEGTFRELYAAASPARAGQSDDPDGGRRGDDIPRDRRDDDPEARENHADDGTVDDPTDLPGVEDG